MGRVLLALLWLALSACSDDTAPPTDGPADAATDGIATDLGADGPLADLALDGPQADHPGLDGPTPDLPALDGPTPDLPALDGPTTPDQGAPDLPAPDGSQPDQGAPDQATPDLPGLDSAPPLDAGSTSAIVVDHTSIALFEQIPASYLAAARNLKMVFSDRSVGGNIDAALNCLTASSFGAAPVACRRDWDPAAAPFTQVKLYTQADYTANTVPARIRFTPDPVAYDRSNWVFEYRQDTWSALTSDFITSLAPQYITAGYQVLSYQFSYLNVGATSDIASPTAGFFVSTSASDVFDLEAYIAQHPTRTFIFWTTSLARAIGTQPATDFNAQMRQYCQTHGKILFDFADIESHTDSGAACWDNADGVQYCSPTNPTNCENHADDGVQHPAICQDYTTELDGGHLGSVSAGQIRAAKAFWVLMARIAGWTP